MKALEVTLFIKVHLMSEKYLIGIAFIALTHNKTLHAR